MKMREILLLLFLALPLLGFSQDIVQAEYFVDNDPGTGNGSALFITANNQIDENIVLNTASLSAGQHFLYVRVMDDQGVWSIYLRGMFYVTKAPEVNEITDIEYFFDEDPGVLPNSGENVESGSTVNSEQEIPTDTLYTGIHFLYARAKDSKGIWSMYLRKRIQIFENIQPEPIIAYEYAFDSISQSQPGLKVDIEPVYTLDSAFDASIDGLAQGTHSFNLRVASNSGKWSTYFSSEFQISDCQAVEAPSLNEAAKIDSPLVIALSGQTDMVQEASAEIITLPVKGTASINTDGNIEYLASQGFVGLDSIEYRLCNSCGSCDSAWVKIDVENVAPEAADSVFVVGSGRMIYLNLHDLFSDINDNLDPESFELTLSSNDISEMSVSDPYEIAFDLTGNVFEGSTEFTITVCDHAGSCTEKTYMLVIEMEGEELGEEITIYNAISPNSDGLNDFMEIQYIDQYPENQFVVFDRWGGKVFQIDGYNNIDRRFEGNRNVGGSNLLPTGTYYYQLHIEDLSKDYRGFIIIKTYDHEKVNLTN